MKQAWVVLGMHRSGTSSVTGALTMLGGAAPKTLMPDTPDNPKGYWESSLFMNINERILASAGSHWSDWRSFNPTWRQTPLFRPFVDEIKKALEHEFGDAPIIVIKDPRMCRFFDIWRTALEEAGYDVSVVIPVRNPVEVAASMDKRDNLGMHHGLLIWLRHMVDAEAASRDLKRSLFLWSDFVSAPGKIIERMEKADGIFFPRRSSTALIEIEKFVDSSLNRNTKDATEQPNSMAQRVFQAIKDDLPDADRRKIFDQVKAELDLTASLCGDAFHEIKARFFEQRRLRKELEKQCDAVRDEVADRKTQLSDMAGTVLVLSDKIEEREVEVQRVSIDLQEAQARIFNLRADRDEAEMEIARLSNERSSAQRLADEHSETIQTLTNETAELRQQSERAAAHIQNLSEQKALLEAQNRAALSEIETLQSALDRANQSLVNRLFRRG